MSTTLPTWYFTSFVRSALDEPVDGTMAMSSWPTRCAGVMRAYACCAADAGVAVSAGVAASAGGAMGAGPAPAAACGRATAPATTRTATAAPPPTTRRTDPLALPTGSGVPRPGVGGGPGRGSRAESGPNVGITDMPQPPRRPLLLGRRPLLLAAIAATVLAAPALAKTASA